MITNPISGYSIRLNWLKDEFLSYLNKCIDDNELRDLVAWYLFYGLSIGLKGNDLIEAISHDELLYSVLISLSEQEISNGKKPPAFRLGSNVEVVVNAKNITSLKGSIYKVIWHNKNREWNYYIFENGKRISKRYLEEDLILVEL